MLQENYTDKLMKTEFVDKAGDFLFDTGQDYL
jgi:hypothetical protein